MVGALPTLLVIAASFLTHVPFLGDGLQWCAHTFGVHATVPAWVGVPAVVLVGVGAIRMVRVLRQHRSLRCDCAGPVHVADDQRPFAVTLPGRGGQIVVSSGLIDLLEPAETEVVMAHEHSHAALEHDHEHVHDDGHHDHSHDQLLGVGGADELRRHQHPHRHEPLRHSHPHVPDLHHRHDHSHV